MLAPPIQKLAVRSYWRPAVTAKSAVKTTLAQGPRQAAGGAYGNGLGEKSANARFSKRVTTHGWVRGRATGGSAVAVSGEPTSGAASAAVALHRAISAVAAPTARRDVDGAGAELAGARVAGARV